MIQRMLAIWSLVPLPFLKPAWTSGSSRFTYCWSLAWRILRILLYQRVRWVQLCGSLSILWHCLSLGLERKLTFTSPVPTAKFSKFAGILILPKVLTKWSLSVVSDSVTLWTVAYQAPPSMGFSKQEYCNELPFPSPGDLPRPEIELRSPALQADALPSEPSRNLLITKNPV